MSSHFFLSYFLSNIDTLGFGVKPPQCVRAPFVCVCGGAADVSGGSPHCDQSQKGFLASSPVSWGEPVPAALSPHVVQESRGPR